MQNAEVDRGGGGRPVAVVEVPQECLLSLDPQSEGTLTLSSLIRQGDRSVTGEQSSLVV